MHHKFRCICNGFRNSQFRALEWMRILRLCRGNGTPRNGAPTMVLVFPRREGAGSGFVGKVLL
jgi:hypothetical protein